MCISPSQRTELLAELAQKKEQLVKANLAYDAALSKPDSYTFDSGDGRQQVKNRKLSELSQQIDRLESRIKYLERKLLGGGLGYLRLVR